MMRPKSWRLVPAVLAVLCLSLGGALLAAVPASAAPGDDLIVTAPVAGSTQTSLSFDVTGTGSDGATVTVTELGGTTVGTTTVVAGGAFTAAVTLPDTGLATQSLTVTQVPAAGGPEPVINSVIVDVTLAIPNASVPFALISPIDGDAFGSRSIVFFGTAPTGSTITAAVGETPLFSAGTAADGAFEVSTVLPFELSGEITVVLTAVAEDGTESEPIEVTITVPEPLDAPVITSPVTGSSIVGTPDTGGTVTYRGTGVPGEIVAVVTLPSDEATLDELDDPSALNPDTVVAADGTFVVSTSLPLGTYSAVAVHLDGLFDGSEILSPQSNEVAFSLVAPASAPELAATGPTTTGLTGPAVLLVFAGLTLLVASSRRRSVTAA